MTAFFLALDDAPWQYIAIVFATALAYWLATRRSAISWFDPWAAQQVLSIFASAAVLFMWWTDIIDGATALYHVIATVAFFAIGGWVFQAVTSRHQHKLDLIPNDIANLQLVVFVVFLAAQLLAWGLTGLPIMLKSRLDAFAAGGGSGILSRLTAFSSTATLFLTVLHRGLSPKASLRPRDFLIFAVILVAAIISASKSSIVVAVLFTLTSDSLCRMILPDQYRPLQLSRRRIALSLVAALGLMLIPLMVEARTTDDDVSAVERLAIRVMLSGDGYMWFYGDRYIDTSGVTQPLRLLFADLLGASRLAAWDALPTHPGFALHRELNPLADTIKGSNFRLDLFGLLFGSMTAGFAFACIAGSAFGFSRALVFRVRTLPGIVTAVFLFMNIPSLLVDPTLAVTTVVNAGLGFLLMRVLWHCVTARSLHGALVE